MALEPDQQYRQSNAHLHRRSIADITVLHRESWAQPLILNQACRAVWLCLEVGGSIDDITADIVAVFDQEADSVRADVAEAFRQLDEVDLIELSDDETSCG